MVRMVVLMPLAVSIHAANQLARRCPPVAAWSAPERAARPLWLIRRGRELGGGRAGGCRRVAVDGGLVAVVRRPRVVITVLYVTMVGR